MHINTMRPAHNATVLVREPARSAMRTNLGPCADVPVAFGAFFYSHRRAIPYSPSASIYTSAAFGAKLGLNFAFSVPAWRPPQAYECSAHARSNLDPRSVVCYLRLKHKLDKWPQARALNTQTTEEGILMSDVLASTIVLVVTALLVFRRELTASRGAKASRREL